MRKSEVSIIPYNWSIFKQKWLSLFKSPKVDNVIAMSKMEWVTTLKKFNVEFVAICIDCEKSNLQEKYYNDSLLKLIDTNKTQIDFTNYPSYILIYINDMDDIETINNTYDKIYSCYGKISYLELFFNCYYKVESKSDNEFDFFNTKDFTMGELPLSRSTFDNLIPIN